MWEKIESACEQQHIPWVLVSEHFRLNKQPIFDSIMEIFIDLYFQYFHKIFNICSIGWIVAAGSNVNASDAYFFLSMKTAAPASPIAIPAATPMIAMDAPAGSAGASGEVACLS